MGRAPKQRPEPLPPPNLAGLADRLRSAIDSAGLSQRDLAALSGVSQASIHALLTGVVTDPMIATVARLAQALRVQAGWLAYG